MRIDAFDNLYYCGETMSCFLSEKYPSHFNVINTAKLHFYSDLKKNKAEQNVPMT
jgi:hypothetical protein